MAVESALGNQKDMFLVAPTMEERSMLEIGVGWKTFVGTEGSIGKVSSEKSMGDSSHEEVASMGTGAVVETSLNLAQAPMSECGLLLRSCKKAGDWALYIVAKWRRFFLVGALGGCSTNGTCRSTGGVWMTEIRAGGLGTTGAGRTGSGGGSFIDSDV